MGPPNASSELLPKAAAECRLEAVSSTAVLGGVQTPQWLRPQATSRPSRPRRTPDPRRGWCVSFR